MNQNCLKEWLGNMPLTTDYDLKFNVLHSREFKNHTEQKISYPGYDDETIPAYLLIPRKPIQSNAGIVAFHQCGYRCDIGKEQVVGKCADLPDQAYGLELVQQGYVVLAPDAAKVGERYDPKLRQPWECAFDSKSQKNCCCARGGSWGNPRWRPVFDAIRSIDILSSLSEVNASQIGAIGHSLGADTIIWALPFEKRLSAVCLSGGGIMQTSYTGWMPYAQPYQTLIQEAFPASTAIYEFAGTKDPIHRMDKPMLENPTAHMSLKMELYNKLQKSGRDVILETEHCGHYFHENGRKKAYAFLNARIGS